MKFENIFMLLRFVMEIIRKIISRKNEKITALDDLHSFSFFRISLMFEVSFYEIGFFFRMKTNKEQTRNYYVLQRIVSVIIMFYSLKEQHYVSFELKIIYKYL